MSNAITRVCSVGQRGERRRRARRRGRRDAAMLPLWSSARISSAASERRRRAWPTSRSGIDRPVLGLVVREVGPDRAVPVDLGRPRARRARAAVQRAAGGAARAVGEPPLDVLDHLRARPAARPSRLASGSASRRLISVAARCTSGVTLSSTSGSSSSRCRPSRSIASCWTTRTTPGREVRAQLAEPARDRRRRRAQPAPPRRRRRRRAPRRSRGPRARAARPCRRRRRRRARAASAAAARRSLPPQQPRATVVQRAAAARAPRR